MRIPRFLEEILPFVSYIENWRRQRRRSKSSEILNEQEYADYRNISEKKIKERLKEEYQRASVIDEKTSKLTLSFSIALTFVGAIMVLLKPVVFSIATQTNFSVLMDSLIYFGLFYCTIAGLVALGALRTAPLHGYGTSLLLKPAESRKKILAESLARQEISNLVRHSRNEAAFQSLRNGLLFFFVVIVMFMGASVYRIFVE